MAVDTPPKITKVSNVAFATETTTGTAFSLTATQGVTNIFNAKMAFNTEEVERQSQGALSPILQAYGARAAAFSCEFELVGAGASGSTPSWMPLMLACGCQFVGGVLSPLTNAISTVTVAQWINGRKKMMVGGAGNCVITFRRGQKARCAVTLMGVQAPVADVTQILPTYITSPIAPRAGASFTFATKSARLGDIKFDFGNKTILREDMGALDSNSEPTGYRSALVVDRKPMITFDPEAFTVSDLDIYSIQRNGTLSAFSLVLGAAAFNTFTLAIPKVQISKSPQDGDRDGLYTDQLDGLCTRNSAAGDDEWTLTLA